MRALFIDEANVARNLFDRSFAELFLPLDHEQYAPPLYLILAKACGELFGYSEWSLRLPALLGGSLAVAGLLAAARPLRLGAWMVLPLALLFTNTFVLRYVTELKPYGLDLGLGAVILAVALRTSTRLHGKAMALWTLAGAAAPWFSLPAVFVLAAVGLRGLYHDRRWILPVAGWLVSFAVLYTTVLGVSVGTSYLDDFHRASFLPIPADADDVRQIGAIALHLMRLGFGLTALSILWGAGFTLYGLWSRPRTGWLLLPLLLAAGASILHYYVLLDRLMLFVLPGIWLVATTGVRACYDRYRSKWIRGALVVLSLLALYGGGGAKLLLDPLRTSDTRALAQSINGQRYAAHPLAVPAMDYYRRIHPDSVLYAGTKVPYDGPIAGNYKIVYDVLTAEGPRRQMKQDSTAAAERGCRVSSERLFRAGLLEIKCP